MKFFYFKVGILAALSVGTILSPNLISVSDAQYVPKSKVIYSNNIVDQAMPSVLAIYFNEDTSKTSVSGTGFAIKQNNKTIIVTNAHVVSSKKSYFYVVTKEQKKYKAKLIYSNKKDDVAFLSLVQKVNIPPLKLDVNLTDSSIGEPVFTIGNPYDFLFSFSNGVISNIDRDTVFENGEQDKLLIQTNINVNPGNSGGPLLNKKGEVIGIVSSMLEDSEGMSFAVPSEIILKNLKKI